MLWHCDCPGKQTVRLDGTLAKKRPSASCHPIRLHPCHQPPATQPNPSLSMSVPSSGSAPCHQQKHPCAGTACGHQRRTGTWVGGVVGSHSPLSPPLITDTVVSLPPHHCLSCWATSPFAVRGPCAGAGAGCGQAASWCRLAQASPAWPWMSHLRNHTGEQTTHPIHLTWELLDLR